MYIYGDAHTHPQLSIGWPSPSFLINIKQPGQAAIGREIWNPPGSWGGAGPGGAGSGGAGTFVLHAYFISKKWRELGKGVGLGRRARAGIADEPPRALTPEAAGTEALGKPG